MTPNSSPKTAAPASVSADEERDWGSYRAYLRTLTPDGLWDAYTHIDPDRFPRRRETIEREMNRRGLFWVSPYTELEQRTRLLHVNLLIFAALAAVLHHIPTATGALNRAATGLNNNQPLLSPTGRAVSLVSGLTRRETDVLNSLCSVSAGLAVVLFVVAVLLLPYLWVRLRRRQLRPDVLGFGLASLMVAGGLLLLLRL